MHYYEEFKYCPRCGVAYQDKNFNPTELLFTCHNCNFHFYQNSIPSATAIIPREGHNEQVLLITRGTEPCKGMLALPGGILNYGESAESAAIREIKEETNIDIRIHSLFDMPLINYEYQGCHRSVLEHTFLAYPVEYCTNEVSTCEASSLSFYDIRELNDERQFAFSGHFQIIKKLIRK